MRLGARILVLVATGIYCSQLMAQQVEGQDDLPACTAEIVAAAENEMAPIVPLALEGTEIGRNEVAEALYGCSLSLPDIALRPLSGFAEGYCKFVDAGPDCNAELASQEVLDEWEQIATAAEVEFATASAFISDLSEAICELSPGGAADCLGEIFSEETVYNWYIENDFWSSIGTADQAVDSYSNFLCSNDISCALDSLSDNQVSTWVDAGVVREPAAYAMEYVPMVALGVGCELDQAFCGDVNLSNETLVGWFGLGGQTRTYYENWGLLPMTRYQLRVVARPTAAWVRYDSGQVLTEVTLWMRKGAEADLIITFQSGQPCSNIEDKMVWISNSSATLTCIEDP